tara:strand:+ start:1063 stop:1971 length:909 start_codon:yes stop_codon:yes gene_type:complete
MKARKKTTTTLRSVDPSDTKNHKIFSYATSTAPSGPNRKKTITVRGLPGSTFTLLAQNESNEVYSFQGGGFDRTASGFTGVIPSDGVFKAVVNTQKATGVDVRLISEAPDTPAVEVITAASTVKANIECVTTGLSNITIVDASSFESGAISVDGATIFDFVFTVTADAAKVINLVRQPHFNYDGSNDDRNGGGFELYDGAVFKDGGGSVVNARAHTENVNGVKILSDIKYNPIADESDIDFKVKFEKVELLEQQEVQDNSVGHSAGFAQTVSIAGTVSVGQAGAKDSNIKLMLFNFLEVLSK